MPSLSCTIASGNWGNRKIGSGFGVYGEQAVVKKGLSAKQHNFSLHAGVWVADDQPKKLRQLIGYVSRAPLAREVIGYRSNRRNGTRALSNFTLFALAKPLCRKIRG